MSNEATMTPAPPPKASGTRILFDLDRELTPEELEKFKQAADAAGAASLTEHFLNLTLRINPEGGAA
jgi:hypothetical protein